jgi:hypothetical protein
MPGALVADEFCAPLPVETPENTASQTSSTYIGPGTNLGCHHAKSYRDLQQCHRRDDTMNRFQTRQLVAPRKCKSHAQGFEHQC